MQQPGRRQRAGQWARDPASLGIVQLPMVAADLRDDREGHLHQAGQQLYGVKAGQLGRPGGRRRCALLGVGAVGAPGRLGRLR